jgi:hypothetical protein
MKSYNYGLCTTMVTSYPQCIHIGALMHHISALIVLHLYNSVHISITLYTYKLTLYTYSTT